MHDRVCGVCVTSGWGRSVVLVWSAHTPLLRLLELRRGVHRCWAAPGVTSTSVLSSSLARYSSLCASSGACVRVVTSVRWLSWRGSPPHAVGHVHLVDRMRCYWGGLSRQLVVSSQAQNNNTSGC